MNSPALNIDSQAFRIQAFKFKEQIINQAEAKAHECAQRHLSANREDAKAIFLSRKALNDFRKKLVEEYSDPAYANLIEIAVEGQTNFFCDNLVVKLKNIMISTENDSKL